MKLRGLFAVLVRSDFGIFEPPLFEDFSGDSLGDCSTTVQFSEKPSLPDLVHGVHDMRV